MGLSEMENVNIGSGNSSTKPPFLAGVEGQSRQILSTIPTEQTTASTIVSLQPNVEREEIASPFVSYWNSFSSYVLEVFYSIALFFQNIAISIRNFIFGAPLLEKIEGFHTTLGNFLQSLQSRQTLDRLEIIEEIRMLGLPFNIQEVYKDDCLYLGPENLIKRITEKSLVRLEDAKRFIQYQMLLVSEETRTEDVKSAFITLEQEGYKNPFCQILRESVGRAINDENPTHTFSPEEYNAQGFSFILNNPKDSHIIKCAFDIVESFAKELS
jgi:hypothetical protein